MALVVVGCPEEGRQVVVPSGDVFALQATLAWALDDS